MKQNWRKWFTLSVASILAMSPLTTIAVETLTPEQIQQLNDVYQAIQEGYIEEVDANKLFEGALKGMVGAVGDPYSEYFNAQEMNDFNESIEDSFEGIGVQFHIKNDEPVVVSAIEGTPAAAVGILPNDVLVSADGVELKGKSTNEIVSLIRGEKGSEVTLMIRRGDLTFEQKIVRDTIPLYSVISTLDKEDATIAHIKITQFAVNTYDELVGAIQKAKEDGATRFVFDVRQNPGGLLDQALKICNIFVQDGDIMMKTQERGQEPQQYSANSKLYGDFKMTDPYVLLVDGGSASASEILTANIKENTDAPIIGEKTFGKGTVQTTMIPSEYGELKLTIAKWLTPTGEWIHETGIEPTEVVELLPIAKSYAVNTSEKLVKDAVNDDVKNLIVILKGLGYEVEAESTYNESVAEAVKQFQKDHQLKEDGDITAETAATINDVSREYIQQNDVQYDRAKSILLERSGS